MNMYITSIWTFLALCAFSIQAKKQSWYDFRTTFNISPFGGFYEQPRTVKEAKKDGWVRISGCEDSSKFVGERYIKVTDDRQSFIEDIVLIFDVNGYIAGLQSVVPLKWGLNGYNNYFKNQMYQAEGILHKEKKVFFTTAYFIDPKRICEGGRTKEEFNKEGTGNSLTFQNGKNSEEKNLIKVPLLEIEAQASKTWNEHLCFVNMGKHYLQLGYDESVSCSGMFPAQVLYHKGSLHGFIWQHFGKMEGKKWEHPPKAALKKIIKNPPTCLFDALKKIGISTMHVYFKSHFTVC